VRENEVSKYTEVTVHAGYAIMRLASPHDKSPIWSFQCTSHWLLHSS